MDRISSKLAATALGLAGLLGCGLAQAHGGSGNVQWSVTIGSGVPVPVYGRVYTPPVVLPAPPVVVHPGYGRVHWDRDRDGIPNRHDHVYNPPWDRDGDGIPNRHDRYHNPRWDRDADGIPNWDDRYDNRFDPRGRHDRDGDGIPNWRDRRDGRRG